MASGPDFTPSDRPVFLVGMPRSGSTLLCRILNDSPDHYNLNDLYVLQVVDAGNGWDQLSAELADQLVAYLQEYISHRSGPEAGLTFANSCPMPAQDLARAQAYMASDALPRDSWHALVSHAIGFSAECAGKQHWGYNTPQDHLHLERIFGAFPNAQVIFLLRNPRDMLKSYKYDPKEDYGDRFHPAAQSLAWRTAARNFAKAHRRWPDQVQLVRYEDLIANPKETIVALNTFLGAEIVPRALSEYGSNSSYRNKPKRPQLTETEQWVSDSVLLSERRALGYDYPTVRPSVLGLLALLKTSAQFGSHYCRKIVTDPDIRKRVMRLVAAGRAE